MLFNSYIFILAFLPVVLLGFYGLSFFKQYRLAKVFLVGASLFFYGWWKAAYLFLILTSIGVNYFLGERLRDDVIETRKTILLLGCLFNVFLLGYFKYSYFIVDNVNWAFKTSFSLPNIVLPLAISFFTFQQIAYLVDRYRGEAKVSSFLEYMLFVSFFPQLIAGPIVHHKTVLPQISKDTFFKFSERNFSLGLFVFSMGLFKKVVIADRFIEMVSLGFSQAGQLDFFEGWVTALAYSMQLYFDFSGYSDMALGLAFMFNIALPFNFDSPYRASNIQMFWRRWHMSLSAFLRDYIYIPLGGNRYRLGRNVLLTFLIGGIWHGANWTFVVWGLLHGVAVWVFLGWRRFGGRLPRLLSTGITFVFVTVAWVFFRADSVDAAVLLLKSMVGGNGVVVPAFFAPVLGGVTVLDITFSKPFMHLDYNFFGILFLIFVLFGAFFFKNSLYYIERFSLSGRSAVFSAVLFALAFLLMNRVTEFLYFNF